MALPLAYNVRNLRARWRTTALAVAGIATVMAVFMVILSMASGFRDTLRATGRTDNAIVVQKGSQSELTSGIRMDDAQLLIVDPRVARGADGQPLASPEIVVVASLPRREDGEPTNVLVRGVTQRAFDVRGGIQVTDGRRFTPGLAEIMVGERLRRRIAGLDLGSSVKLQRRDWEVVGFFTSTGNGFESEIWGDLDVMSPAFKRVGYYETVVLRLANPETLPALAEEMDRHPRLKVEVKQERRYYAEQAGTITNALTGLALFVFFIMAVGAVFGAMNTMFGIVAERTREIGTLRALGFSRRSILLGFLVESLGLTLTGGLIGCLLALPANTLTGATLSNFSELAFAFRVTPRSMVTASILATMMGVAGGLLPALRAARLPITSALREG